MLATIRKALMAAGFTFAGTLGATLLDGAVTAGDVLVATGTALAAGAATWAVPNAPSVP